MTSLTRVELPRGTWTLISGEMVANTVYHIEASGTRWFRYAELSTTPDDTTGYKVAQAEEPVRFLYDGTGIYAYAVDDAGAVNILSVAI